MGSAAPLILAWQLNGQFTYDPELVTEVELSFTALGPTRTQVSFEHRDLDRLRGTDKLRNDMDAGWGQILESFLRTAEEAER